MKLNILSLILVMSAYSFGQISVTSSDLLGLIGKSGTTISDTTGSISVSPGPAGENKVWDFTSLGSNGNEAIVEFLDPQNTPYSDKFPTANFAQSVRDLGDSTSQGYSYSNISPTSFHNLGFAFFADSIFVDKSDEEMVPLPLIYGGSWETVTSDTFGVPGFMIISKDSSTSEVDAWGTITIPVGTFDCLRIRDNRTYFQQTFVNDFLISSDTTTRIDYDWITKSSFSVAYIGSQDGETDPNFSTAQEVEMLKSFVTSVNDNFISKPLGFELFHNYPNPFNPETVIKFQMSQTEKVRIDVYDINGKWITTLVDGQKSAGSYSTLWNGKTNSGLDVASGIYYYTLTIAGNNVQSRKMTLIR